jgi:hypothetical protein
METEILDQSKIALVDVDVQGAKALRAVEQKRRLAFCVLSHERLGQGSIWAGLEQGLLQMVLCNKH